jgi:hypothetical protein
VIRIAVMIPLALVLAGKVRAGEAVPDTELEKKEASVWEYSISASTYFALHSQDYVNPIITADRDWLHLEARYNYESLKTASLWLGYNFSGGEEFEWSLTPMFGGVFGNLTGVAPGYSISASWKMFEFFTQGEFFIDAATSENNYFYTWSELSVAPVHWLRVGFVADRTKALAEDIAIRRGPLVGLRYGKVDFTTYWLSPGARASTFIFAVTANF